MEDDTRLTPPDDTRLTPPEDTRMSAPDVTRLIGSEGTVGPYGDDTVLIEEATVVRPGGIVDDLSDVRVTVRPREQRDAGASPMLIAPGGDEFSLHRAIAVGRRPVTPLAPTERILLLTWDPDDREVSATHLVLEPSESGVVITDVGSSNGTRVTPRGRGQIRLGPRESFLVTGEATVEFGRAGKIVIVPAPASS